MAWLTAFGVNKSRLTVLIMIGLIAIGSILYNGFPKREDPEITIRQATVTIEFNGMGPERMERLIADPVERKIREIPEVDEINTQITTGTTRIDVLLKDQYTHLEPFWQELRDKMEEVARELPSGASGPYVNTSVGDVSIASIAMTAEGFSFREMELAAKTLQRKLYTLDGIASVKLFGIQEERIWLEIDAERLAAIGVQIETLIADLQSQNIILPAGTLNANGESLLLEATGDFNSVEEISDMLTQVKGADNFVRLGDIVTVRRGVVSPKVEPVYYNSRPAIVISVEMQSGIDIEAVGAAIETEREQYEKTLPIGYQLEYAAFQPTEVSVAVNDAVNNVLQTVLVVLVIMMLFLGFRSGLIIASIVPLAVMFTLIGMSVVNINLEQVSIAAIIISLGLLVDNGVVVVEDILRRIDRGESKNDAALQAGAQFSTPLLVSSLTTIFAFIPFFLMDGNQGEYAFSLGAVVAITLFGSWLAAMYFLPFICKYGLLGKSQQDRISVPIDEFSQSNNKVSAAANDSPKENNTEPLTEGSNDERTGLVSYYTVWLKRSLAWSPLVIAVCYFAVIFSVRLISTVPSQMFPLSDRTQVLIYQEMPRGTDISATEKSALEISHWLSDKEQNPEVANHITYVGSGGPRFYLALTPGNAEPENAFFLVNLNSFDNTLVFWDKIKRHLIEKHPEARFKVKRLSMGAGESGTVEVKITGPSLDRLLALAREVETGFRAVPGISQNENDWGEKKLKVVIAIDQDKARRIGISSESMAQLLSAYFDGLNLSDYREDDQSIPIMLRAATRNRDSAEDLMNLTLGSDGQAIALEQIASLQPKLEYSKIRRSDQVRTITITGQSDIYTASELAEIMRPNLDALELNGGYQLGFGGELEDSADTYEALAQGLPIAFLLMLAAIIFQFNSFRRAIIIFMSVPLVIIGVPFGLLLLNQPLSFFGNLGLISLAGIIINNAIVLIDQIDIEARLVSIEEAIVIAAGKRLRPILLTSATTVAGLLPLYLFGSSLWTPLAVVMMSGLAVASLMTLFFVPACYLLLLRR